MTQATFLGPDHQDEEGQRVPETAARHGPGVDPPAIENWRTGAVELFVGVRDLYAATAWGDALRLVHGHPSDVRLFVGPDLIQRLLLRDRCTGMWHMQGTPSFEGVTDAMMAEAGEEALEMAAADPTVDARTVHRLRRHIETTGGGSAARALRRVPRLAADPTVHIPSVDVSVLNPVAERPVLLAGDQIVGLSDGRVLSPCDLRGHYLLDVAPGPTSYVPDAVTHESPGTAMMRRFLRYLGNGDDEIMTRRLGWQLCGRHATLDVIAGDHRAMRLLARALRETLGPSGVHILSLDRGDIKTRDIAQGMEVARLCVWPGADTRSRFPVWEIHDLISQANPFRQGNLLALVADWPEDWDTLDHRIASACGWAWRVQETLDAQGIDVDAMLDPDGRECLLAMLVSGAVRYHEELQGSGAPRGAGDPGQVAGSGYSRACAEEMRVASSSSIHRALYRAIKFTDDPDDVMTMTGVADALTAVGEGSVGHHVIGKTIRRMWPAVESGRDRIDGVQTRVVRRVAPRSEAEAEELL